MERRAKSTFDFDFVGREKGERFGYKKVELLSCYSIDRKSVV